MSALFRILILFVLQRNLVVTDNCPGSCICTNGGKCVVCKDKGLNKIPNEIPKQVEILDLTGNDFAYLYSKSFISLNNLQMLILENCKIENISKEAFDGLINLNDLNLANNLLFKIEQDPFQSLKNLLRIKLNHNVLLIVPNISGIKIARLDFNGNKIWKALFGSSYKSNKNLKSIVLDKNDIESLSVNELENLRNTGLQSLSLADNRINYINEHYFEPVKASLQTLKMKGNLLGGPNVLEIGLRAFEGSKQLRHLDLSDTGIVNISNHMFQSLSSTKIRTIILSNNRNIHLVEEKAFRGLTFLERLSLYDCNLVSSMNLNFRYLTSLKSLNLSYNNLSSFPNRMPSKVEVLDLSNNNISSIRRNDLATLSSLKSLNLAHNMIKIVEQSSLSNLGLLTSLDLSYNILANIQYSDSFIYGGFLPDVSKLRFLDLSHNKISGWSPQTFLIASLTLVDLNLAFNRITFLSANDGEENYLPIHFLKLQRAGFGNNPWNCTCNATRWLWMERRFLGNTDDIICEYPDEKKGDTVFGLTELKNCTVDMVPLTDSLIKKFKYASIIIGVIFGVMIFGVCMWQRKRIVNKVRMCMLHCRQHRYKPLIDDSESDFIATIEGADHAWVPGLVVLTSRPEIESGNITKRLIDSMASPLNRVAAYHCEILVIDFQPLFDESMLIRIVKSRLTNPEKRTYLYCDEQQSYEEVGTLWGLFNGATVVKYENDIGDKLYDLYE